ncbi:MAG: FAD-linked oxidase C-terminal domain-containing protein [Pseudomonadota bacterium]|nr:FAD-linked oxidase C-terminal domain-containing protein [Pseudomonadota bacterium]
MPKHYKHQNKNSEKANKSKNRIGDTNLAARLNREVEGDVLFDPFSRGQYSTDASIYQIQPIGVVVPQTDEDVVRTIEIAREEGVPVLPRGGGTSQCGQTVGEAIIIDTSKNLNRIVDFNAETGTATVQPGVVLDELNQFLRQHGVFFPIDPSTSSRATLGGMAANNSCGGRSIRYGLTVNNVSAIDAILADGTQHRFTQVPSDLEKFSADPRYMDLVRKVRSLGEREEAEIARRFPKLLRRVGGYNIDTISTEGHNMAQLLVGSEGTLAYFRKLELITHPIPSHNVLGICHFSSFRQAMDITQEIVKLDPSAVELIDSTMIALAREITAYRPTIERFVNGNPEALLMVEFSGENETDQQHKLDDLEQLLDDHGFPNSILKIADPNFQRDITEVRKAGLNIMMSMKGDGKPVSFIEDCAVPLNHLGDYTERLTEVFSKHGVEGTWYAHASVGCLHVRPVLNMKASMDVRKMRDIAEETFAMVREYKGSHSGEHGDGIVRSEFHTPMFGERLVRTFEDLKELFDPKGLFNPGKIVHAPRMDDRSLFRYQPDYEASPPETVLDWSEWGGFTRAIEMCNNNGACRKSSSGVMCPSYRVTKDEKHLTRGRANSLRLAITGQLGPEAMTSDAMAETMDLCVSCKACKLECPTGVDMARMKIEILNQRKKQYGTSVRDRLIAFLPRYAPYVNSLRHLTNVSNRVPLMAPMIQRLMGFSTKRPLPTWCKPFEPPKARAEEISNDGRDVVMFVDTFSTYFHPENTQAAYSVLNAANFKVHFPTPTDKGRPLCCGRTFLAAGLIDQARAEAKRVLDALTPFVERGIPVIGLEPACLLTFRDELPAMNPCTETEALASHAFLFEEFLIQKAEKGLLPLPLQALPQKHALLHGHCHQKAFGAMDTIERVLGLVPELEVKTVETSCCGMAGSFGYEAEHFPISMAMGELKLLPAVREASENTLIVADGSSCREQIRDGTGREALHVARVLNAARVH